MHLLQRLVDEMDLQYICEYNIAITKAVKAQEIFISKGLLGNWHLFFSESEEKRIAMTEKKIIVLQYFYFCDRQQITVWK